MVIFQGLADPIFSATDIARWYEQTHEDTGEKPTQMVAKAPTMPEREMPLCAYPTYAKFVGGDKNSADSYQCVPPWYRYPSPGLTMG